MQAGQSPPLDLSSLREALAALDASLQLVGDEAWLSEQSQVAQRTLTAGVIQHFEFVYELSVKMLRRRLELDAASPTEVDFADFRDVLRQGMQRGLITDPNLWFRFRAMRNITSHTYDVAKAGQVFQGILGFLPEARGLLAALEQRNG